MSQITRRAVTAGIAALPAAPALAALPDDDPIYAAVARYHAAFSKALDPLVVRDEDLLAAAMTKANEAALDILDVEPTTVAGVGHFLSFVAVHEEEYACLPDVVPVDVRTYESAAIAFAAKALQRIGESGGDDV